MIYHGHWEKCSKAGGSKCHSGVEARQKGWPMELQAFQPHPDPWKKMMEQLILKIISRHSKDKRAIRSSQYGCTKGKSCLTTWLTTLMKWLSWWTWWEQWLFSAWATVVPVTLSPTWCGWADSEVVWKVAQWPGPEGCDQ